MPKGEKTYKEPTCVQCGCTEFKACLVLGVGCSWVKLTPTRGIRWPIVLRRRVPSREP